MTDSYDVSSPEVSRHRGDLFSHLGDERKGNPPFPTSPGGREGLFGHVDRGGSSDDASGGNNVDPHSFWDRTFAGGGGVANGSRPPSALSPAPSDWSAKERASRGIALEGGGYYDADGPSMIRRSAPGGTNGTATNARRHLGYDGQPRQSFGSKAANGEGFNPEKLVDPNVLQEAVRQYNSSGGNTPKSRPDSGRVVQPLVPPHTNPPRSPTGPMPLGVNHNGGQHGHRRRNSELSEADYDRILQPPPIRDARGGMWDTMASQVSEYAPVGDPSPLSQDISRLGLGRGEAADTAESLARDGPALSWKLDPVGSVMEPTELDSPPERQKDYIDEAEMDESTHGGSRYLEDSQSLRAHDDEIATRKDQLWRLSSSYLVSDVPSIQRSLVQHVEYTLARRRYKFDRGSFYQATAHSVRDRLIERWTDTQQFYASRDGKRMYYLSLEFLVGRSMGNAVSNLGLRGAYAEALRQLGYDLEDIMSQEKEPALGNGGLGRLASCFLDTLATLNYPAWGYGIRYKYGMFEQRLVNGKQVEFPDYWLTYGNPWEVERLDVKYLVRLYGEVKTFTDETTGETRFRWEGGEVVVAVAYDTPIPGYGTYNTNNMRLWSSKPSHEFDLASFNAGDYYGAVEAKERCESITSVLYPSDDTDSGKVLRLKQQFFFVSATLQDVLRRYKKRIVPGRTLKNLPEKVAIQLNDTHPSISIPELMRLLLDEEMLPWDEAWDICNRTFGYTNHTILPEALEKWQVPMMEELLPRHMQIIYEINHRFLQQVEDRWPGDNEKMRAMSIIEESTPKMVRMAHLAIVGSHVVNGVAEIHTRLVKSRLFPEFDQMFPGRIKNVTNGVTPRRWILQANPAMAGIFTSILGPGWVNDLRRLATLKPFAHDDTFQHSWNEAKRLNKERLALWVKDNMGVDLMTNAIYDMQVKRIHEYKRQLLNVLGIIHRYAVIASSTPEQRARMLPRVCVVAGKAAPGYEVAKKIIQLACAVSKAVNNDVRCAGVLQVVFIPNFNVSLAELIIPASDVSQHISTAGMEASGTGNMKFVMNGGLIVGTADGANIEIARAVGEDNLFCFGATADEVAALRSTMKSRLPAGDERLQRSIRMIKSGVFGNPDDFAQLMDNIEPANDYYLLSHDFPGYLDALDAADAAYLHQPSWTARTIRAACSMWEFSSDRTIKEYAEKVWQMEPLPFKPPHHQDGGGGSMGGGGRRGPSFNGRGSRAGYDGAR